jgi:hypothetical protein
VQLGDLEISALDLTEEEGDELNRLLDELKKTPEFKTALKVKFEKQMAVYAESKKNPTDKVLSVGIIDLDAFLELGLGPEEIAANDTASGIIIEVLKDEIKNEYQKIDIDILAILVKNQQAAERLLAETDVQKMVALRYGTLMITVGFHNLPPETIEELTHERDELLTILSELGLSWPTDDQSIRETLVRADHGYEFDGRIHLPIENQTKCQNAGLWRPEFTDYIFKKRLEEFKNDDFFGSRLSPDVDASAQNEVANYWQKMARACGFDALGTIVKSTKMAGFNEYGSLDDGFFEKGGEFFEMFGKQSWGPSSDDLELGVFYLRNVAQPSSDAIESSNGMFNENGATEKYKNLLMGDIDPIKLLINNLDLFDKVITKADRVYLKLLQDNDFNIGLFLLICQHPEYVSENGIAPELWQDVFRNGTLDLLVANKDLLKGLTVEQQSFLDYYEALDEPMLKEKARQMAIGPDVSLGTIEQLKLYGTLWNRIEQSNSSELRRIADNVLDLLLKSENPIASLDKVEGIFVRNNLPEFAKAFLVFNTLHGITDKKSLENDVGDWGFERISPVLRKSNIPQVIIFRDLMKCALGSNNRSLKGYLGTWRDGELAIDELDSAKDESSLSETKAEQLQRFLDAMDVLYSEMAQADSSESTSDASLKARLERLRQSFGLQDGEKLTNHVMKFFGGTFGFETFQDAIDHMDQQVERADQRGRAAVEQRPDGSYRLKQGLKKGDVLKGLSGPSSGSATRYLYDILQNGSVAQEFLGDASKRDTTPLDIDLGLVGKDTDGKDLKQIIRENMANSYGSVIVAIRADERFVVTRTQESFVANMRGERDTPDLPIPAGSRKKYELFVSTNPIYSDASVEDTIENWAVRGGEHMGIRTGLPSGEIDFVICRDPDEVSKVAMEIAKNGFYIPVVDESEVVVFTPEDYDKLREKISGSAFYETGNFVFSSELAEPQIIADATEIMKDDAEIQAKDQQVQSRIEQILAEFDLLRKISNGSLTPGFELINTGSTGRATNILGDGDFDYSLRLDRAILQNSGLLNQIQQALATELGLAIDGRGNLRASDGSTEKVDITFIQKTNKLVHTSEQEIIDRLENIRGQSPEQYEQVIANIVFAKKLLKQADAYKPRGAATSQGGLGGIGIENWILQNGGSFVAAAREFMVAAEQADGFEKFKRLYKVYDLGQNQLYEMRDNEPFDEFVDGNMNENGYQKMKAALAEFLAKLD